MDWEAAIEWNRQALTRVLAMLVAMTGFAGAEPGTLPRRLHRAVLRLLRPAEAAARRLVIAAARGLVAIPPPLTSSGRATGLARPSDPLRGERNLARGSFPTHLRGAGSCAPPRLGFALFDPLPRYRAHRPIRSGVPRISAPGFTRPFFLPVRLSPLPDDRIDAARLALRLAALGRVLDDLPRHARRLARWRARLDRDRRDESSSLPRVGGSTCRAMRIWPLGPGRPAGSHRRPDHEVHRILDNAHGLALSALAERRDTS